VWSGWIFTFDHDPALKKFSLGRQLLHSMLEEGQRQGHRQFDFSTGDEEYKWLYATHARLLGPIGVPPLKQRLIAQAAGPARKLLARYPNALKFARSLSRSL
jgi:CelD/BcsL family acetyltransferase involved in cellulose biosynthesis